ncbi:MAG: MipA/OmpV family protein [Gammaproteobacteria bacterium]
MNKLLCTVLFAAGPASLALAAQVPAPGPLQVPEASLRIGTGAAYVPEYAGAQHARAFPLLDVEYTTSVGLFASSRGGIGYQASAGPARFSAALGVDPGRRERSSRTRPGSNVLRGMGDVRSSSLLKLGTGYDLGFMSVGLEANLALTRRERGNSVELAAQVPLPSSDSNRLALVFSADYGDRKYTQLYFGVTPLQSQRSGYAVFKAKAGFNKVALGLNWSRPLTKNWSLNAVAGGLRMVGDAANSPITKKKTAPVVLTTVNYSF